MERKKVTFIVATNQRGNTRRFVISVAWLRSLAFILSIFLVAVTVGVVDYFGLLVQSVENKNLKAENSQLQKQFQIVEGKLNSLENTLERVKSIYTKLKLITNVEDDERPLKLAIGPLPRPGQTYKQLDVPIDERQMILKNKEDQVFFKKTPVDEDKGEISVDGSRDYASLAIRIDKAVKLSEMKFQGLFNLWSTLSERQSLLNATPSIRPVRGWATSKFGYRISPFTGRPVMHNGVDIAAAPGSPVYSPAEGVVSYAGYDEGYGKLVSIDHGYGVVTRFGHNSQIFVTVGQKVKRWDVIAAVGNTGRSTGPHVHYEVRVNNMPIDPANYILSE